MLIHSALGCNESNDAAGPHLIQRLGKEVIVNQEVVAVKLSVGNLVRAEGHIADGQVEEILSIRLLKARDSDVRLWVQILRNPSGDAVQLYAVQPAVLHAFRQKTEEIADTA